MKNLKRFISTKLILCYILMAIATCYQPMPSYAMGEELIGDYSFPLNNNSIVTKTFKKFWQDGNNLMILYHCVNTRIGTDEDVNVLVASNVYNPSIYQSYTQSVYTSSETGGYYYHCVVKGIRLKAPTLKITSPGSNLVYGDSVQTKTMTISGTINDQNIGDTVNVYYSIDGGTQSMIASPIIDNATVGVDTPFPSLPIDMSTMSEGSHSIKFWATDSTARKSTETIIPFKVDKSAPSISGSTLSADSSSLTASVVASDPVGGLATTPYRYTVSGFAPTSWLSNATYTLGNLVPNSTYTVTYEVKDAVGHISTASKSILTKAQVPTVRIDQTLSSSFNVSILDNNPDSNQYLIVVNDNNYLTLEGTLTASPIWVTLSKSNGVKPFIIKGLTPETSYNIKVKTRNGEGVETLWSAIASGITLVAPPAAPGNIVATATDKTITTSWDPVVGASGYDLEIDGQVTNVGTATQYTKSSLNAGTPHTFRLRSKNVGGAGAWSDLVNKSTLPAKPNVPANVAALPTSTIITVTWDNVAGATGYDIEVDDVLTSIGPNTSYKHTSLDPGTQHRYRIRSINAGDKSDWSAYVTATTLLDTSPVPANLIATPTQDSITLSWDAVASATGYDIEVDGVAFDNGNKTSYTHSGAAPSVPHKYRVRSKKGSVSSDYSAMVVSTTSVESFGAPTVTEDVQDTSITLRWNPVKDATTYEVEVGGAVSDIGSDTAFVHSGLTPNKTYTYRVRSKGAAGVSDWSALKTLTTTFLPTPQALKTTATDKTLQISWNTVTGATAYDVEFEGKIIPDVVALSLLKSDLTAGTQYPIRVRSKNTSGVSSWSPVLMAQTLGNVSSTPEVTCLSRKNSATLIWPALPGATAYEVEVDGVVLPNNQALSYVHTGLTAGSKHVYRVRGLYGANPGAWSAVISVMTLAEKPAVPTNVAASSTMTSILLSWDEVSGATSYEVEVDGVAIVDNGTGKSYLINSLTPGVEHKYRVRSKNLGGYSDWSAIVTKSTVSSVKKYDITSTAGDEFNLILSGSNIQALNTYTFTVTYNPDDFTVLDLCGLTSRIDMATGSITGTNIKVVQFVPGTIVFTKTSSAEVNEFWTSIVNSVKFSAKKTGTSSITYTIN